MMITANENNDTKFLSENEKDKKELREVQEAANDDEPLSKPTPVMEYFTE